MEDNKKKTKKTLISIHFKFSLNCLFIYLFFKFETILFLEQRLLLADIISYFLRLITRLCFEVISSIL